MHDSAISHKCSYSTTCSSRKFGFGTLPKSMTRAKSTFMSNEGSDKQVITALVFTQRRWPIASSGVVISLHTDAFGPAVRKIKMLLAYTPFTL